MRVPEKSPAGKTPRSIQEQPLRKRTVTVLATFVLALACILTGTPAATAATVPAVNLAGCADDTSGPCAREMYIPSASDSAVLACGGACPGLCPCPSELKDGSVAAF